MLETLRKHWPEYAIEAWALATFMMSAGIVTILVEHPGSPVRAAIGSALLRRALVGTAMGATAIGLIYSRWGRRSGAHMNPAVTLTFLRLGKIAPRDAAYYIAAQFAGALVGVLAVLAAFGRRFADAPVSYVATLPAPGAPGVAFGLELLISCGLMAAVLTLSNNARLMPYTGLAAGLLVAIYITFEAPFSGMSMNPARSFASAATAGLWRDLWIYFAAPSLGMQLAASIYTRTRAPVHCAKLFHAPDVRCIHCGYKPHPKEIENHEDPLVDSGV